MLKTRVIPCLLLKDLGLVKTVKFKDFKYIGDPINAVKIFNDKEVDELIFLDTAATIENREPNFDLLAKIASESFMPLGYGGGIKNLDHIKKILNIGVEKVIINSHALKDPEFVRSASDKFGSQSIVVAIDVKTSGNGVYEVFTDNGKKNTGKNPIDWAMKMEKMGAGEIFLNSIDKDGTMEGYDLELIKEVSKAVNIPVIASGGAGKMEDFSSAVGAGASAVSAGSIFVFVGNNRAVLISYPDSSDLSKIFKQNG